MDWSQHADLAATWQQRRRDYVAAINRFIEVGTAQGWDAAGEEPDDLCGELAAAVLAVVEEANRGDAWRELRAHLSPAHEPFVPMLAEVAVGIEAPIWIDSAHVVARVGTPWRPEAVCEFGLDGTCVMTDAFAIGRSPERRWFAVARNDVVEVREGYRGAVHRRFPWPAGREPLMSVQPFPDGEEVLLTREDGVFILGPDSLRALPFGDPDDDEDVGSYGMLHAAMSWSGDLVAFGHQASGHLLCARDGRPVACFGPVHSEYPHHAAFSPDGTHAIFNACHMYGGVTVVGEVAALRGLDLDPYAEDPRLAVLEDGSRIYASTFHDDAFVLGDAHGNLRAHARSGELRWQLFCGSTIGGVDVSPDGRHLATATAAGYLQFHDLRAEVRDPFQIGTLRARELLRFIRWRGRPMLRW